MTDSYQRGLYHLSLKFVLCEGKLTYSLVEAMAVSGLLVTRFQFITDTFIKRSNIRQAVSASPARHLLPATSSALTALCHVCVEVRGQPDGASALLPPLGGFQE